MKLVAASSKTMKHFPNYLMSENGKEYINDRQHKNHSSISLNRIDKVETFQTNETHDSLQTQHIVSFNQRGFKRSEVPSIIAGYKVEESHDYMMIAKQLKLVDEKIILMDENSAALNHSLQQLGHYFSEQEQDGSIHNKQDIKTTVMPTSKSQLVRNGALNRKMSHIMSQELHEIPYISQQNQKGNQND